MKKITELTEKAFRTEHKNDANGNRTKSTIEYNRTRKVNCASHGIRFANFFLDIIVFQILFYIIDYIFSMVYILTNNYFGISLTLALFSSIVTLISYPIIYAIFEFYWQRTPAKYLTKTLVIDEYGNKPDFRTLLLRSFVRIIPFEQLSFIGTDKENNIRGWHDRWSNTWVVKEDELALIKKIQQEQIN